LDGLVGDFRAIVDESANSIFLQDERLPAMFSDSVPHQVNTAGGLYQNRMGVPSRIFEKKSVVFCPKWDGENGLRSRSSGHISLAEV
jgi:hypothetical protein